MVFTGAMGDLKDFGVFQSIHPQLGLVVIFLAVHRLNRADCALKARRAVQFRDLHVKVEIIHLEGRACRSGCWGGGRLSGLCCHGIAVEV